MSVKNIIFDVGNVLVKWSPADIIKATFLDISDDETVVYINKIFKTDIWTDLNLGSLTEEEAKIQYKKVTDLTTDDIDRLFDNIKSTQLPIPNMHNLLSTLKKIIFLYMLWQIMLMKLLLI